MSNMNKIIKFLSNKKLILTVTSILVFLIALAFVMSYFDGFRVLTRIVLHITNFLFVILAILIVMQKDEAKTGWIIAGIGALTGWWLIHPLIS